MSIQRLLAPILLTLLLYAQSPTDLFQKALHAQETAGDIDAAIGIYRQVVASASSNRMLAAQAQYQLVLCMIQKGDRPAAAKELDALTRNFPDQPDLIDKARRLVPTGTSLLPAPWGEGEYNQLNIKRGGAFTGETLYYALDQFYSDFNQPGNPQAQSFRWELTTAKTRRSVFFNADRSTMQPLGEPVVMIDDALGDADAAPFTGPAIDVQQSVFLMRRLPLAPGFKTTLTSWPLVVGQTTARQFELAVVGIEPVQVTAGRFNCFKVVFSAIGQTFWIAVDGPRPLVKIETGGTEAELVKTWGPESLLDAALVPAMAMGFRVEEAVRRYPSPSTSVSVVRMNSRGNPELRTRITATKVYTPSAQIDQALRDRVKASLRSPNHVLREGSIQARVIGGKRALSWWLDGTSPGSGSSYHVAICSESAIIATSTDGTAVTRWRVDPIIEAIRIP